MAIDMMRIKLIVVTLLLLSGSVLHAQKYSLSMNLLECARLGTLNIDASYAIDRHWSLTAGARYNPFTYHKGDSEKPILCQ